MVIAASDRLPARLRGRRGQRQMARSLSGKTKEDLASMDLIVARNFTQMIPSGEVEELELPTAKYDDDGKRVMRKVERKILKEVQCLAGEKLPKEILDDPATDLRRLISCGRVMIGKGVPAPRPNRVATTPKPEPAPAIDPEAETDEGTAEALSLEDLSMANTKDEIMASLEAAEVPYSASSTKGELLELADDALGGE